MDEQPGDPFLSQAWLEHLRAHGFLTPPVVHVVRADPGAGGAGTVLHVMPDGPSQSLSALSNYYSGLFGPVGAASGSAPEAGDALARALKALPCSSVVRLQPLDPAADWVPGLTLGLRRLGYVTSTFFCFANWYHPVLGRSFADYWAERPTALRNSVERGRRRLQRAGPWRVDIHTGEHTGLEQAIAAFQAVYARSWKAPEPNPGFMPGLMRLAARQGWLRLGVLWLDGEPLAAQLWLFGANKAHIFKLAYVQGAERLSAGSVLTAALMEHALDVDRVREVDYLAGDEPYKADWMSCRRERIGLLAFDPLRWRGLAAAVRHFVGRWSRRWRSAQRRVRSG